MFRRIWCALLLACALFAPALAMAQAGPQVPYGEASSPAGTHIGATVTWAYNATCNGGAGGWVGASYGAVLCAAPPGSVSIANTPAAVVSYRATCSTTAQALPSTVRTNGVTLRSLTTNTGLIYIGGSSVTTSTGDPMGVGDRNAYAVLNDNQIYYVCANASDVLSATGN